MGEKMITIKRGDLEQVVRNALRLGSQAFGVKHKRLVQGIMEEAEEKAVEEVSLDEAKRRRTVAEARFQEERHAAVILPDGATIKFPEELHMSVEASVLAKMLPRRAPGMEFDTSADGLDLKTPPNSTCTGGCGIAGCPGNGEGKDLYHHAGTGDYFSGEADNLSELLRSRVKAHPAPEVPTDPREYRGMSAERAAFIAWMNDIPRVPHVETGCGVDECCPGLPADIVELAKWSRRVQIIEDLENLPGFDERGLDRLHSLSAEQLEQVLYIAKG